MFEITHLQLHIYHTKSNPLLDSWIVLGPGANREGQKEFEHARPTHTAVWLMVLQLCQDPDTMGLVNLA